MAGVKPSVNLFALLDRSDAGDKRLSDFDAAKNTATPAAPTLPSARDAIIKQNQLEKKAKQAKKRAAARAKSAGASADGNTNKVQASRGGYNNNGPSRQQQSSGSSGGYSNGRQQPAGTAVNKVQANGAQRGGYNNNGPSRQQQSGPSGGYKSYNNNGAPRKQQPAGTAVNKVPAEGMEAPPAPVQAPAPAATPPPSIDDINEFPSLK